MTEFEVTCKVEKGERDIAYGDGCYCYYTQPNYTERIVRCKDCKHSTEEGIYAECYFCHLDRWNTNPVEASPVEPDGFCKWGKPMEE